MGTNTKENTNVLSQYNIISYNRELINKKEGKKERYNSKFKQLKVNQTYYSIL